MQQGEPGKLLLYLLNFQKEVPSTDCHHSVYLHWTTAVKKKTILSYCAILGKQLWVVAIKWEVKCKCLKIVVSLGKRRAYLQETGKYRFSWIPEWDIKLCNRKYITMNSITCCYRDKIVWSLVDEICDILQSHDVPVIVKCFMLFHIDLTQLTDGVFPPFFRFYLVGLPSNSGPWRHARSREACSWKEQDLLHQFIGSLPLPVLQRTANVCHALRRLPVRKRNRKFLSWYHVRLKNAITLTGIIDVAIIDSLRKVPENQWMRQGVVKLFTKGLVLMQECNIP